MSSVARTHAAATCLQAQSDRLRHRAVVQRILQLHGALARAVGLCALGAVRPEDDEGVAGELDHVAAARRRNLHHLLKVHVHQLHHLAEAIAALQRKVLIESGEAGDVLRDEGGGACEGGDGGAARGSREATGGAA